MRYLNQKSCPITDQAGRVRNAGFRAIQIRFGVIYKLLTLYLLMAGGSTGWSQASHDDPLLNLLIQKGMLTQEEAEKVRAEADAQRTNETALTMPESKWRIGAAIKNVELYGDLRLRFEDRQAITPSGDKLTLDRGRVALRVGFRGDLFDDFYYGFRLETSSNPRSTWINFGGSSPGPFGKSANGIDVGQAYIGWRPEKWVDITVGRMANPLDTTPMLWDPDINPEGAAEHFYYSLGKADFFVNFGQFLYQDNNPSYLAPNLAVSLAPNRTDTETSTTFLLAWQAGVNYHFTETVSAKVAGALYNYIGLVTNTASGIGDPYIGEGAYGGANSSNPYNGVQGGYNQTGVNSLLVLDVPFEVDFKINKLNARVFGDFAYNLDGADRARAAVGALATQAALSTQQGGINNPPLLGYGPQTDDVKAYQIGFALASGDILGLVNGSVCKKNGWEVRAYWQHVEQYALDPNLPDSDFFEGRGNLQGFFTAVAYGFSDNVMGIVRFGEASRINNKLGTGGSNLDIPQINPIQNFQILQLDLNMKF